MKLKQNQFGQSMIEYTVVIMFGVLTLTTGPMRDTVNNLMQAMRDNYRGYSFAISLSDIPDSPSHTDYSTMLDGQNVPDELKKKLTDRTSTNAQRNPADLQREIDSSGYNGLPTYITDSIDRITREARNIGNISFP
jgi:hypothetical protein